MSMYFFFVVLTSFLSSCPSCLCPSSPHSSSRTHTIHDPPLLRLLLASDTTSTGHPLASLSTNTSFQHATTSFCRWQSHTRLGPCTLLYVPLSQPHQPYRARISLLLFLLFLFLLLLFLALSISLLPLPYSSSFDFLLRSTLHAPHPRANPHLIASGLVLTKEPTHQYPADKHPTPVFSFTCSGRPKEQTNKKHGLGNRHTHQMMQRLPFFRSPAMGLVASLTFLSTITVQQVQAFGHSAVYNGTYCQGFVDYQVWLPDGATVALVEQGLNATGIEMVFQLPDPCKSTFLSYACSVAYPRPVASGQSNSFNVLFACGSSCQAVNQACGADVAYLQQLSQVPASPSILPDCMAPIQNTDQYPQGAIPHQPDNSCNAIPFQSTNSTCSAPMAECASPFVRDLVFHSTNGLQNTDDAVCGCGCCLPCPQTNNFYKPGLLDRGFLVTDILKGVSAGLSLILVISYLVLPGKLQHPSNLILFAAISTCIFSAAVAPSYGNPRRIQCSANGITPASSYNNPLCTAQGAWLLFGAISTTAWLSMVIVNLHMHTVWNSNWLSQRAWISHIIGWVVPASFAAIAVVTKSIGWNNSNMCMATQDSSNVLLFIPLGVIMIPSILLHIATFAHIIRVTLQSENSETVSHSTLSSGKAARISHRRHVMNAIRIQWRAAVLALVVSGSVLVYWAFYLVEGGKTDMSWMSTWQLCIFLGGSDQEQCGQQFARGHVPDFLFMMVAEGLVSTTGLWIFLLFFKGSLMQEWRDMISGWICCGGRRTRKREEDQFYVI